MLPVPRPPVAGALGLVGRVLRSPWAISGQLTRGVGGGKPVRRATLGTWGDLCVQAVAAAAGAVARLGEAAGRRVVAAHTAAHRADDPETIGVDEAAEAAILEVIRRAGVNATVLSEEAGEVRVPGEAEPVKRRVLADQLDLQVHCHVHETAQELEDSLKQHGQRPPPPRTRPRVFSRAGSRST